MTAALGRAAEELPGGTVRGRRAVVLGAGAVGALAVAHLVRLSASDVVVVNRTPSRAHQVADDAASTVVRARPAADLVDLMVEADMVVACASSGPAVVSARDVAAAVARRPRSDGPLVVCDLGLPRNVAPEAAGLDGVVLLDLQSVRPGAGRGGGRGGGTAPPEDDVAAALGIAAEHAAASWSRTAPAR